MTSRHPLPGNKHPTIVSVYVPRMFNPDEVKDKFYNKLDVISATPRTETLIPFGDFNARVGTDQQTWEVVGTCNGNGLLLLGKCAEHD